MKRNKLPIATAILALLVFAILVFTIITYNKGITERKNNIEDVGMKLIINEKEYHVDLSNNNTTLDLLNILPYKGSMANYEESFFIINIAKELSIDGEKTTELKAKNIYYNPAWKSLVLVYKDYTYEKNKMVLIGSIEDDINIKNKIADIIIATEKD